MLNSSRFPEFHLINSNILGTACHATPQISRTVGVPARQQVSTVSWNSCSLQAWVAVLNFVLIRMTCKCLVGLLAVPRRRTPRIFHHLLCLLQIAVIPKTFIASFEDESSF
jgi:hypothetical protein